MYTSSSLRSPLFSLYHLTPLNWFENDHDNLFFFKYCYLHYHKLSIVTSDWYTGVGGSTHLHSSLKQGLDHFRRVLGINHYKMASEKLPVWCLWHTKSSSQWTVERFGPFLWLQALSPVQRWLTWRKRLQKGEQSSQYWRFPVIYWSRDCWQKQRMNSELYGAIFWRYLQSSMDPRPALVFITVMVVSTYC